MSREWQHSMREIISWKRPSSSQCVATALYDFMNLLPEFSCLTRGFSLQPRQIFLHFYKDRILIFSITLINTATADSSQNLKKKKNRARILRFRIVTSSAMLLPCLWTKITKNISKLSRKKKKLKPRQPMSLSPHNYSSSTMF